MDLSLALKNKLLQNLDRKKNISKKAGYGNFSLISRLVTEKDNRKSSLNKQMFQTKIQLLLAYRRTQGTKWSL